MYSNAISEESSSFPSSASVRKSNSPSLFQVRLECHSLSEDGVKVMVLLDNGVGPAVYSSAVYIAPESHWDQEALQQQVRVQA